MDKRREIRGFNPRLRTGGDPTRTKHNYQRPSLFQSTPPHGRRRRLLAFIGGYAVFQSTPPHGRRHTCDCCGKQSNSFNPRLRTGGDVPWSAVMTNVQCFNPRLRTGGDAYTASQPTLLCRFQSTPPHGRRHRRRARLHGSKMFQSTPPHGRRQICRQRS